MCRRGRPEPINEKELLAQLDELDGTDLSPVHPGLLEEFTRRLQNELQEERAQHQMTKQELKKKVKALLKLTIRIRRMEQELARLEAPGR